ncbi:GDSL family lipase [Paenibacillus sp. alder61]|uniref:GDSL family lipase n=1 Tax=Paenibacillus sp. alder61 TaxID=2862948 RepID=UPI001CD30865|nr:GDSL family lipase [Paenibacillus sp. alder61]MCA1296237.1 GDSL family lipase [Paenibacillus sp. alder61]
MALYERPLSFKFDFGPGPCAEGYVKVDPGTRYDPQLGYGFETHARVYGKQRTDVPGGYPGAADPLKQSFCIPLGASFVVDVPGGTYRVKLLAGDALAETVTNVKAGEGRQMLPPVHAAAGQWLEAMFSVSGFSQLSTRSVRNKKPPAMRVEGSRV